MVLRVVGIVLYTDAEAFEVLHRSDAAVAGRAEHLFVQEERISALEDVDRHNVHPKERFIKGVARVTEGPFFEDDEGGDCLHVVWNQGLNFKGFAEGQI